MSIYTHIYVFLQNLLGISRRSQQSMGCVSAQVVGSWRWLCTYPRVFCYSHCSYKCHELKHLNFICLGSILLHMCEEKIKPSHLVSKELTTYKAFFFFLFWVQITVGSIFLQQTSKLHFSFATKPCKLVIIYGSQCIFWITCQRTFILANSELLSRVVNINISLLNISFRYTCSDSTGIHITKPSSW